MLNGLFTGEVNLKGFCYLRPSAYCEGAENDDALATCLRYLSAFSSSSERPSITGGLSSA